MNTGNTTMWQKASRNWVSTQRGSCLCRDHSCTVLRTAVPEMVARALVPRCKVPWSKWAAYAVLACRKGILKGEGRVHLTIAGQPSPLVPCPIFHLILQQRQHKCFSSGKPSFDLKKYMPTSPLPSTASLTVKLLPFQSLQKLVTFYCNHGNHQGGKQIPWERTCMVNCNTHPTPHLWFHSKWRKFLFPLRNDPAWGF